MIERRLSAKVLDVVRVGAFTAVVTTSINIYSSVCGHQTVLYIFTMYAGSLLSGSIRVIRISSLV